MNMPINNGKHANGLGALYENRNKVLLIGDIQGVKGNPADNITQKGLFESKYFSTFEQSKTQVDQQDPRQMKTLQSQIQRARQQYAKGAIDFNKYNPDAIIVKDEGEQNMINKIKQIRRKKLNG